MKHFRCSTWSSVLLWRQTFSKPITGPLQDSNVFKQRSDYCEAGRDGRRKHYLPAIGLCGTLTKIDSLISSCLSDTGSVKGKLSVCLAVMINSLVESTSSAGCSHTLHLFSQVDLDSHVCCFVL